MREYDDWRSLHSNLDMEEEEQQGDDFEEVLEANPMEGELLVVRTSLAAISTEEEKVQKEKKTFRTRGSVQGKVCNIIIDNGSCTNVASKYMVDKLKLKTEPHPRPYKLQWLSAGNEAKVTQKCLISFSIGPNYHDDVLCDVLPMDACHILPMDASMMDI